MNHAIRQVFNVVVLVFVLIGTGPVTVQGIMTDADFLKLCAKGAVEEISKALSDGARINAKDEQDRTTLMYAAKNNADPTVIKVLLMAAADFKERGLLQSWKSRPIFKTLDVNDRNEEGMTALMFAVENNSPDVVQVLLDAGYDSSHAGGGEKIQQGDNSNAAGCWSRCQCQR